MKWIFTSFLIFIVQFSIGQNYFQSHFGGKIGLVLELGTHKNSIGVELNAYYTDYFYQINVGNRFVFNNKSLGKRTNFIENRTNIGAMLFAGKKQTQLDFETANLNRQTNFNAGIGYQYLIYWDNAQTTQLSGAFAMHIREFSLYWENDIFGGQGKDRFRTNEIQMSYYREQLKLNLGINLWTGETAGARWEKYRHKKNASGHRILEDLPYGRTSHGILSAGAKVNVGFNQIVGMQIGWDSELVRHAIQNRFAHDLFFLPKKFKRNTPHYPMLGPEGCAVFDKSERRKDRLYWQFRLN